MDFAPTGRNELNRLDDRMLADIGLARAPGGDSTGSYGLAGAGRSIRSLPRPITNLWRLFLGRLLEARERLGHPRGVASRRPPA